MKEEVKELNAIDASRFTGDEGSFIILSCSVSRCPFSDVVKPTL
jgi:hypothetical protein